MRDYRSLVYVGESEQNDESLYTVHVLVPKSKPSKEASDVAANPWSVILLALHKDESVSNLYIQRIKAKCS